MIGNKRTIILFFITLFVVLFFKWVHHPLPIREGIITIDSLIDTVNVYSDPYGVPHVFASNERDLFFTAGYIAAQDRLFQLSMVLLAVRGELSSVFGKKFLKTDIYLRTWKIYDTAKVLVSNMDDKNRRIFDSFCKGINYRINEVKNDLPIEFKILGFEPKEWSPEIVAGYTRMMAHEMSGSWIPEVVFGAVNTFFGKEKLRELIPDEGIDNPTIASGYSPVDISFFNSIIENENILRDVFGDRDADVGSNNWVVSGKKTVTGKPMLANDPHLAFSQPPRWYEIHLRGGRFNVSGVCIAGIPLPVIGQNDRVAWGFTNTMVDDLDFFVERLNPENKKEYLHGSEWKTIISKKEIFRVKGGDNVTKQIRSTHHGPVISDIHPLLQTTNQVVSMSWTGHWVTNEMDAWVQLTTMKNWDDFTSGVELFGVPGQNIVYADVDGNIGWRPAVYIPIRKKGYSMIPRPGHDLDYDWKGKVPFEEMPYMFNPKKEYISTANNKTIGDSFPYYISGLWADPSRAKRIELLLDNNDSLTIEDMKSIQLDYGSELAKDLIPHIVKIKNQLTDPGHLRAMAFLEGWDFVEGPDSEAALIFHMFLRCLTKNIYKDEFDMIGKSYYEAFMNLKYLTNRNLRGLINGRYSSWVDNVQTLDKIERLDEIMYFSFIDTYNDIVFQCGPNWSNWKWGDVHTVTHNHILGKQRVLNYLLNFNVGPYRSGGSDGSPNAGGYSRSKGFSQTSGASMRRIVDFSNLNNTQMILPTGQSGLRKSPHYDDQAHLYHRGVYRTTHFNKDSIENNSTYKKLTLSP